MHLTHQPWRECVELVRELDVGAFTPDERDPYPGPKGRHTLVDVEGHAPRTREEDQELWADRSVDETTSKAEAGKHNLLARSSVNSGGMPRKAGGTGTPTLQKPSCSLLSCPSQ